MKFRVTLKSPDACDYAIEDECERYEESLREDGPDDDEEEIEAMVDELRHELQAECERWFSEAEYATVELDTEEHTATIIKPGGR